MINTLQFALSLEVSAKLATNIDVLLDRMGAEVEKMLLQLKQEGRLDVVKLTNRPKQPTKNSVCRLQIWSHMSVLLTEVYQITNGLTMVSGCKL